MDLKQLLEEVVRPTLKKLGMHSASAEQLVMGTIAQESRGKYIKQLGSGPALGLAQMEPSTHDDIWLHYLNYKPVLAEKVSELGSVVNMRSFGGQRSPSHLELVTNLAYMVAMCRIHYRRKREPLPKAGDIAALGHYWKTHYNTPLGKGTVSEFVEHFPKELFT
ncbi:hypothetical protein [Vibrio sp. SCSIO 43136]|uniref:hypothetical protein n=1 Tax=Vibrio sp. SCSIO 43136 TaxID=2819101 RepID=UPI002075D52A|nr:hypothetical protein [Vibrio sp. SCSIO 43136]USD64224.1 hypothetical protein J4N39_08885 [Vibrio sp. SCSIO 43136]